MTAPTNNNVTTYNIQRASVSGTATSAANSCNLNAIAPNNDTSGAPTGSAFSSIGALTITAGQTGTFTNFDLSNGGYCYRVMVQNPNIGTQSFSNYVPVNIPGTSDVTAPRSTSATLSQSGGFANTLDAGDKILIDFNEAMSIAANAVIRVTDSDCGNVGQSGPATCTGATTNTVADIICATNATCVLQAGPAGSNTELSITTSGNPTIVSAGSTSNAQFPVVVTDTQGVTDLSGNTWDLAGSGQTGDRVFGPIGN